MSVDERISLIEKIWSNMADNNIEQELDERIERYAKGGTTSFSWNDIKNELANR